jgi:hypothetical protein
MRYGMDHEEVSLQKEKHEDSEPKSDVTGRCDTNKPTYRERLKIGWILFWRLFAGNFAIVRLLGMFGVPNPWRELSGLTLSIAWIAPLAVETLFSAKFHGFHISFVRDTPVQDASSAI